MKTVINLKHGNTVDTLIVDDFDKDFLDYVKGFAEKYEDFKEDYIEDFFSMIELDLDDHYEFELANYYKLDIN